MYSDLIIGFDGSPQSHDALALGRRLAEATGARPLVVCVHPSMPLRSDAEAEAELEHGWREEARRALDDARAAFADLPDTTFRVVGDSSTARALHSAAEEADAALIVLGSTHREGLGRVIPGTTADQVLHAAPCAVAVAPAGYAQRDVTAIGVVGAAVDGGDETERVARLAAHIAQGAGAKLRVIKVIERHYTEGPAHAGPLGYSRLLDALREAADAALERAATAAGDAVEVERRAREGHPEDELIAESGDLDLLVVGSRGFGPLRRIVIGSVSGKVLRGATCPVLVLPRCSAEQLDDSVARLAGTITTPAS